MPHGLAEVNRPGVIAVAQTAQAVVEPPHILFGQATPPAREQNKAEKGRRGLRRHNSRLAGMQRQAPPSQMRGDSGLPLG